jgi:hypothetical protein
VGKACPHPLARWSNQYDCVAMPETPEIAARRICSVCVRESFLRAEILREGTTGTCFYCEKEGKTFSIQQLADRIDAAFEQHYEVTPSEPTEWEYMIRDAGAGFCREGDEAAEAIAGAADIDAKPAEDVRLVLEERHYDHEAAKMGEECPFESGVHYAEKAVDYGGYQEQWASFERRLRQQERFFSRFGFELLSEIFSAVHEYKTREGQPAVVEAGPGKSIAVLSRARVFQSDEKLTEALKRPDLELGSPPWRSAPEGRMNARGISMFYAASDAATAIAEVRPPVGSKVAVAEFEIIRPLKLLNVPVLEDITISGSIFDPAWLPKLQRVAFLRKLSEKISRPVMPDEESFDYLITQAIADYLATEQNLDGIIYASAQTKSPYGNVALFHRAARVELVHVPEGTEIDVQLEMFGEDGAEPSYRVWVEAPPVEPKPPPADGPFLNLGEFLMLNSWRLDADDRPITLRINRMNVQIHHVKSVKVDTESHAVMRHETQATAPKESPNPTKPG